MTTAAKLQERFGQSLSAHPVLDDPLLAQLLERRTCRQFSEQRVTSDLIDALLNVASSASSKSDYQQASTIVIQDPERRRKIAELVPAMPWIGTAPAFLVFCADARRLEQICAFRGRPVNNRSLEAFFNASIDAALVMQTFIIAAEQIGLGCCPVSVIRNHLPEIRNVLSLPDRVVPIAALCVGYPAQAGYVSMRLPVNVTRHRDNYSDNNLADAIDDYDRRRARRASTPRNKQRMPERFGHAEFYGWSEDKCRQMNAEEGKEFGAMVRDCGFTLD